MKWAWHNDCKGVWKMKCKNCNQQHSNEARFCPNCGAPVKKSTLNIKILLTTLGILIVIITICVLLLQGTHKPENSIAEFTDETGQGNNPLKAESDDSYQKESSPSGITEEINDMATSKTSEVTNIIPHKETVQIKNGESEQLLATTEPDNASKDSLNYESSDNSIASVDKNGVVSGLMHGEAIITARVGNATCHWNIVVTDNDTLAAYRDFLFEKLRGVELNDDIANTYFNILTLRGSDDPVLILSYGSRLHYIYAYDGYDIIEIFNVYNDKLGLTYIDGYILDSTIVRWCDLSTYYIQDGMSLKVAGSTTLETLGNDPGESKYLYHIDNMEVTENEFNEKFGYSYEEDYDSHINLGKSDYIMTVKNIIDMTEE